MPVSDIAIAEDTVPCEAVDCRPVSGIANAGVVFPCEVVACIPVRVICSEEAAVE